MNLYVIRHGETIWNVENRLQGQVENDLTKKGMDQAYTSQKKVEEIELDYIICSTLKRCKDTATIINQNKNIPIRYDDRLKERSYGELEGLYGEQIDIKVLWDIDKNYSDSNVEPVKEFLKRNSKLLDEYRVLYSEKNVLLVTHSGNSIAINCYYNGIPADKNLLSLGLKNCEILHITKRRDFHEDIGDYPYL